MPHMIAPGYLGASRPDSAPGPPRRRRRAGRRRRWPGLSGPRLDHDPDERLGPAGPQQDPPVVAELGLRRDHGLPHLGAVGQALGLGDAARSPGAGAPARPDPPTASASEPARAARIRSASAMPVSTPSPVVDCERKMMWPDCSPPRAEPVGVQRGQHVAVADVGLAHRDPRASIASRNPRFVMTVTTTVLPVSRPRSARSRRTAPAGRRRRRSSPVWSTAMTRSASPSRAKPRSAPGAHHDRASCAGSVDPHAVVDVGAVGRVVQRGDRRRRARRSTAGATSLAAPLAQSTTIADAVEPPPVDRRHQVLACRAMRPPPRRS